jgi:uncharacterized membrane protein
MTMAKLSEGSGTFFAAVGLATACVSMTALAQAPYRLTIFDEGSYGAGVDIADINNAGQVVMSVGLSSRVVVWDGFGFTEIGPGRASAINDRGDIVGEVAKPVGVGSFPVLWSGGAVTPLQDGGTTAPGFGGFALDINNRGQVVGNDAAGFPTVWQDGSFARLSTGAELCCGAGHAINELGHVVGYRWHDIGAGPQAAVWDDRGARLLDAPVSYAHDINDRGQIVGMVEGHARLWSDAGSVDLGAVFGADHSSANAINEAGLVVGYRTDGGLADEFHAVLWNAGVAVDLNTLVRPESAQSWWLTQAYAVNDRGDIVGRAVNRECTTPGTCQSFGFLLSPSELPDTVLAIPEPSTYALMLAGLGAIGWLTQRRRAANASE